MADAHTYFVGKDAALVHDGKRERQNHGSSGFYGYTDEEIKELLRKDKGKYKLKLQEEQKNRGARKARKRKK